MNSFISSFRPFAAAILAIVAIEAGVFLVDRPNFAQRSSYLDFNYLENEYPHKVFIYEKLSRLVDSQPGIIQVGDSSGFYAIRPAVVMEYLSGLTYGNFSCCANTGWEGYFDIASTVLDHDANAKAIVLYVTLDALPANNLVRGDKFVGGAERIHAAFASPWDIFAPPSEALRREVTQYAYTLDGILRPMQKTYPAFSQELFFANSVGETRGWMPERDFRMTTAKLTEMFDAACGPEDMFVPHFDDSVRFLQQDWLGRAEFTPKVALARFAELAARRNVKLIVAFHPHPCAHVRPEELAPLRDALQSVEQSYPNLTFIPDSIFEHWPRTSFSSAFHLRMGYDVPASRRLGRLLAAKLGLPVGAHPVQDEEHLDPSANIADATDTAPSILGHDPFAQNWTFSGIKVRPAFPAVELAEEPTIGTHYSELKVHDLAIQVPYVLSAEFKPLGDRSLTLVLEDAQSGRVGSFICDGRKGVGTRGLDTYEADIEEQPDGWYRCWMSLSLCSSRGIIALYSTGGAGENDFLGNDKKGLLVRSLRLQQGWHLQPEDPSAPRLPKLYPITEPCPPA